MAVEPFFAHTYDEARAKLDAGFQQHTMPQLVPQMVLNCSHE